MRAWILASFLAAPAAWSQPRLPADPCPEGVAVGTLEGLDVRARLFTNGNLFFGEGLPFGTGYQTPLTGEDAGKSPLSMANLWIGARAGGAVRVTAAGFQRFALRPGVTGPDGTPPTPAECASADRIFIVSLDDVAAYLNGGTPTDDLRDWPAHLGAPVLDGDGDPGNYNLAGGDQPAIRGDVSAFWAMTDTARPGKFPMGLPVGVDVSVEAFAFRAAPFAPTPESALASATAYRVTLTNRSGVTLDSLHLGLFTQHEIGNVTDSYVATDTTWQMAVGYNSDNLDDGSTGYGIPPAFGLVVVDSPDGPDGAPVRMRAMRYFENAITGPTTDPQTAVPAFHSLTGRWADGTSMREGGNGYGPQQGPVTTYAFSGDPVTGTFWSERNNNGSGSANAPGQRRLMPSSGPVTLAPDASAAWTLAVLFAQGGDYLDSIVRLRGRAEQVHALQAAGAFEPQRVTVGTEPPTTPASPFTVRRAAPNPFTTTTRIDLAGLAGQTVRVRVVDVLGREVERQTLVPAGDAASVTVGAGLAAGVYVVEVTGLGSTVPLTIAKTR